MTRKTLLAAAALASLATAAHAGEYHRIGNGPDLEVAKAYCDMVALNGQMRLAPVPPPGANIIIYNGYNNAPGWTAADQANLNYAAASFGAGIRSLIVKERITKNCMVLNGWKWGSSTTSKPKTKTNWNNG